MKKHSILVVLLVMMSVFVPAIGFSQATAQTDPAMAAAREEMNMAQDLGRFFGFILQMIEEEPRLNLTSPQARQLHGVIERVLATVRLDGETTEEFFIEIEDDILTPAQLLYTDKLFAEREATRVPAGTGQGRSGTTTDASAAGGSVTTFMNGGAYNPLTDTTKQQGQDTAELKALLARRL